MCAYSIKQKSNEWDFWYKNNECVNTIQSTFHMLMCLLYIYWNIIILPVFYFTSFQSAIKNDKNWPLLQAITIMTHQESQTSNRFHNQNNNSKFGTFICCHFLDHNMTFCNGMFLEDKNKQQQFSFFFGASIQSLN